MADGDIQNLKIVAKVDISKATTALSKLQDELNDLAEKIEQVDSIGTEGIDINTNLKDIDKELAAAKAKVEAAEKTTQFDIDTNVDRDLSDLFEFHHRSPMEFRGRAGMLGGDGGGGGAAGVGGRDKRRNILLRLASSIRDTLPELDNFKIRMSDLHNLLATLVPVLLVFIGTIPAVVNALVTLAGAAIAAAMSFMAIAGLGAMGAAMGDSGEMPSGEDFKEILTDIRDSFFEAFAPLAQRLSDTFEGALDGLEIFFEAIASQGDALVALTDEAEAFGQWATDFIPSMLRTLAGLVESMDAVFGEIASFLSNNFNNIVQSMVAMFYEALPALRSLAGAIMDALPGLVRFSAGLTAVAAVIVRVISGFIGLAAKLGITAEQLGAFVGIMLTAMTMMALWNTSIVSGLIANLVKLGAVIVGKIGQLLGFSAANVIATVAAWGLYQALLAVIAVATLGLGLAVLAPVIGGLADHFLGLSSNIDAATNSMKDFNRVSDRASGINPYGGNAPASGAGAAGATVGSGGGGGQGTSVTIESSGDEETDKSNGKYAGWRMGRTSGGAV